MRSGMRGYRILATKAGNGAGLPTLLIVVLLLVLVYYRRAVLCSGARRLGVHTILQC